MSRWNESWTEGGPTWLIDDNGRVLGYRTRQGRDFGLATSTIASGAESVPPADNPGGPGGGTGSSTLNVGYTTAGDAPLTAATVGETQALQVYAGATNIVTIDVSLAAVGRTLLLMPARTGGTHFRVVPSGFATGDWIIEAGATDYSGDASDGVISLICQANGVMRVVSSAKQSGTPIYTPSYVTSPGDKPFVLPSTTPPAGTGATGTSALSSEVVWKGEQTWKLTNTTTSGTINFSLALAPVYPAPRVAPHFVIPVYIPDYKSVNDISIVLSMGDTTYANTFTATWGVGPSGHADKQFNGWHFISVSPATWAIGAGSPAWTSTINGIRIRFLKNGAGGNQGIIYVGQPLLHELSVAQLLLYADDVHRTFYNNGLPVADALGLKMNLACASGWIANPNYMDLAMYKNAQDRGHEICVHSYNQIGVDLTTYAAAIADIATNQAYVRDVIKARFGYKHFVYPNGRYWNTGLDRSDVSVINHMRDTLGIVIARTTDDPLRDTSKRATGWSSDTQKYNQLLIPETIPNNVSNTLAAMKAAVDALIEQKAVGSLVAHYVGPAATHDFQLPGVWQQLLEHVAMRVSEGSLRCPTGEQFYAGLG